MDVIFLNSRAIPADVFGGGAWGLTFITMTHDVQHDGLLEFLFFKLPLGLLLFVLVNKLAGFEFDLS